jgi:hypothetical protein
MADIRIKDLATTAASTASDDFVAVDGSANGTRKLNAYSPTFGGNLTVSGTGTSTIAGSIQANGFNGTYYNANALLFGNATYNPKLTLAAVGGYRWSSYIKDVGGSAEYIVRYEEGSRDTLTLDRDGNTTLTGNLTVSGTGTSSVAGNFGIGTTSPGGKLDVQSASAAGNTVLFRGGSYTNIAFATGVRFVAPASTLNSNRQFRFTSGDSSLTIQGIDGSGGDAGDTTLLLQPSGGNLLIGTTTDSGNGKLQLATHTTSAGGIGFGTDTSWYRSQGGVLTLDTSANFQGFEAKKNGTLNFNFYSNSSDTFIGYKGTGSLTIQTLTGSPALTLDSSQNATFAGSVKAASQVYAEKSGAGIAGQSVGLVTQFTTVNSTTYSVTTAAAKVFVVQLGSGDAALCYTSYKSSTITILGSDGTIVNSNSPSSTQLGIWKGANDHVIYFVTGSNALAGSYGSWGFCFLGNPVISIA